MIDGPDVGCREPRRGAVTQLLAQLGRGDEAAWEPLMEIVYEELRQLARARLRFEPDSTLGTTELVHEAYLRLASIGQLKWQDRGHFFTIAARAMRRLLIDRARAGRRLKRGGGERTLSLPENAAGSLAESVAASADDLIALDQALDRLATLNERQRQVVELRFFAGLNLHETAEALAVSVNTVKRDWSTARLWLNRELAV